MPPTMSDDQVQGHRSKAEASSSEGGESAPKRPRLSHAEQSTFEEDELPTEQDVVQEVDRLFAAVDDRDAVTVGDVNRSVASHYGWETAPKSVKKLIKARLTELIRGANDEEENGKDKEQTSGEDTKEGGGDAEVHDDDGDEDDEPAPPKTVPELITLLRDGAIDTSEFVRQYHKIRAEEEWREEYGVPPPTEGLDYDDPMTRIMARHWVRENQEHLSFMEIMNVSTDIWK